MRGFGRAGITALPGPPGFVAVTAPQYGNDNPGWTGSPAGPPDRPGPHPRTQFMGGDTGDTDGFSGADPASPKMSPHPHVGRLGAEQENTNRPGIIGWNDQLQIRDRHAYWSRGRTLNPGPDPRTGGSRNPQLDGPPMPTLRTVNISVNPQIGSDATSFQDDLTRPYTWLGQADGTVQPIYGGVPGFWQSYGNRGMSAQIHDPTNGEGGPQLIRSGPPHGLHSDTMPSGKQVADRYITTPQMRPVRLDRPSNSTSAGQSYSQTVQPQGGTSVAQGAGGGGPGLGFRVSGRGWLGGS